MHAVIKQLVKLVNFAELIHQGHDGTIEWCDEPKCAKLVSSFEKVFG